MEINKEKYAITRRVSGKKQFEEGMSLETQYDMAMEIVKKNGGVVYDVYDEPALSARKKRLHQRPVMQKLIQDIRDGKVNHVIAYRRDRLWRNTLESLQFIQILLDYDCKITLTATEEKQIDLHEYRKNGGTKMMELIMAQFAEMEVENTSLRVSDNMIAKAKKGEFTGGVAPYGYYSENSRLILIESEVSVINEIEDLYLQGYGCYNIARYLNGMEVKGLGKRDCAHKKIKQHSRSRETWSKDNVEGVLFNHTYCGYLGYYSYKNNSNGSSMDKIQLKSDYVTPVRTMEKQLEIDRMREKKKQKRKPPRHYSTPFLLSGILTCKECGGQYKSRSSTRADGKAYHYYACENVKRLDERRCKAKIFKKDIIEPFVLSAAKDYMEQFVNDDTYKIVQKQLSKSEEDMNEKLKLLEKEKAEAIRNKDKLFNLMLDLNEGDPSFQMLKESYNNKLREFILEAENINTMIEKLKDDKSEAKDRTVDIEFIEKTAHKFTDIIETAPINIQKQLIEELFSEVSVDKNANVTLSLSVDFISDSLDSAVDFISLGGVGEPTNPKHITREEVAKPLSTNVFNQYVSIIQNVSDNLFPFMIHKNGGKRNLYKRMIESKAILESSYYHYKNKDRTPTYESLLKILDELKSSVEEFIDFINPNEKAFYKDMLQEALDNKKEFSYSN